MHQSVVLGRVHRYTLVGYHWIKQHFGAPMNLTTQLPPCWLVRCMSMGMFTWNRKIPASCSTGQFKQQLPYARLVDNSNEWVNDRHCGLWVFYSVFIVVVLSSNGFVLCMFVHCQIMKFRHAIKLWFTRKFCVNLGLTGDYSSVKFYWGLIVDQSPTGVGEMYFIASWSLRVR